MFRKRSEKPVVKDAEAWAAMNIQFMLFSPPNKDSQDVDQKQHVNTLPIPGMHRVFQQLEAAAHNGKKMETMKHTTD